MLGEDMKNLAVADFTSLYHNEIEPPASEIGNSNAAVTRGV
jgi:hypothetical protein